MRSTPSIFRDQVSGGAAVTEAPNAHAEHHVHAVSPLVLVGVFSILMLLTIITVAVTKVDFGYQANLVVALAIACVKAFLVIAYFMHLRYDSLFYTAIVGICVVFIGVFIITTMLDTSVNMPDMAPEPVTAAP
jgi:cytochrome c oxidase subunit 4